MYQHELTALALVAACVMGMLGGCDARGLRTIVAGVEAAQGNVKAVPTPTASPKSANTPAATTKQPVQAPSASASTAVKMTKAAGPTKANRP